LKYSNLTVSPTFGGRFIHVVLYVGAPVTSTCNREGVYIVMKMRVKCIAESHIYAGSIATCTPSALIDRALGDKANTRSPIYSIIYVTEGPITLSHI
jgi:hypothetical protein